MLLVVTHDSLGIKILPQNYFFPLNGYKRGIETCPQVNLHQSGREYFLLFFRRVRATSMTQRRVEHTRIHLGANSPVSVNHSNASEVK